MLYFVCLCLNRLLLLVYQSLGAHVSWFIPRIFRYLTRHTRHRNPD